MSGTALPASTRFFLPGTTKVLVLPAVASYVTGPTRANIDAGTDISDETAALSGWMVTSEQQATPDLGGRFVRQVTGRLTAADSSITCWADVAGDDIRALLEIDQETNIAFLDGGDVPGSPLDCYKVTVASLGKVREIEGVGRIEVRFTIREYVENLVVPAAS